MLRLTRYMLLAILALGLSISACKKDPDDEPDPEPEPKLEFNTNEFCDNSCYFARDGECDDGGYGSTTSFCKFGTDCSDCGIREIKEIER